MSDTRKLNPPASLAPASIPWFVLFFDLVVVAAFSQTAKTYQATPTWYTSAFIAACILLVYSLWAVTTIEFLVTEVETWTHRVIVLVQMTAILVGALSLGRGSGLQDAWGFAALSVALGCGAVLTGLRGRIHQRDRNLIIRRAVLLGVASLLFFGGALVPAESDVGGVHVVLIVFYLATPVAIAAALTLMPQLVHRDARERSHVIQERFGLILLIVLGDSFLLLLGSVGSDNTIAQPLFFIASVLLVFSIWALYFPELSKAAFPETLRAGYARLGAHFLLVLSSTVAIVACTWMTKYSFPQLAASVRQEGAWTALPIFTISASILWLTLLRDRRMSAQSVLHLTCSAVLLVLALFGIFANDLESYWLLLAAVGVLIAQAILSLSAFRVFHSVV